MSVAIEYRPFSLALAEPLETASGTIEERRGWLIELSGGGPTGIGEATPLPGWTEPRGVCEAALERARRTVAEDGLEAAIGDLDDAPAARHGVSLAWLDRMARRAGQPLYRYLGASDRIETVPINATVGAAPPERTRAAAAAAVDRGVRTVKCKVGGVTPAEDARRLAAVREAVGPSIALRADANGAWSRSEADRAFNAFATLDLEYLEQPLTPTALEDHARLRRRERVPIALDETVAEVGPEAVIAAEAADVLVCKPMVLGGIDRTLAAVQATRRADLAVTVTTTVDGAIARAGAVHAAAATAPARAHGLATGDRLASDLAEAPLPVTNGDIAVPQGDGLGIRPDGGSHADG